VIPFDDPTILFINAGMNQFKDVFTGRRTVDFKRATSVQKCIRAGGKHNDLDNVGFTARHHTFFEMLGNFSFGDYYKEEAIRYAWEWLTGVLGLPKDRLYATVYEEDDEAFSWWEKIAPELKNGRIIRFGKKDNYWSMGNTGPCGPSSEVHFDRGEKFGTGPDDVVNGETERFVEIWNLVFMQYDQVAEGKIVPLPNPSVDTGAGLERIAAIMQDVESNYGIDLFQTIIDSISDITGAKYIDHVASHHVIADHMRALTFSLADGAGISNEGRGYVLRRILRRAARHGRNLGVHEPFMYRLVPVLVEQMGDVYPEITEKQQHVMNVIRAEEESFGKTLETGLDLFNSLAMKVKAAHSTVVDGTDVFKLYDTYGFPYDLTEILAIEHGLTLDEAGFNKAMQAQQERSRANSKFESHEAVLSNIYDKNPPVAEPTEFDRELRIQSALMDARRVTPIGYEVETEAVSFALILDKTPFYIEAGGQISDTGYIYNDDFRFEVKSVWLWNDLYVHEGTLVCGEPDSLKTGTKVTAEVDSDRRWDIMRNHTVTHLAHAALRKVLGDHVKQSGSYVGPDRMRFDFSHHEPMSRDQVAEVERLVNEEILKRLPVQTEMMDIKSAKKSGAMALFGEKYGDTVRVVTIPGFSIELCGGTHVENVSQIGPFFVTLETGIASGVRRIEAITGQEAVRFMREARQFREQTAAVVGRPESEAFKGVEQLKENNVTLQRELKKARAAAVAGGGQSVGREEKIDQLSIWSHDFGDSDKDTMAAWLDSKKEQQGPIVVAATGMIGDKLTFIAGASNEAISRFAVHAGNISKDVLSRFGGRGGGKPNFAQGSAQVGTPSEELFSCFRDLIKEKVLSVND
jgi:alanyl-tRNA synthetase